MSPEPPTGEITIDIRPTPDGGVEGTFVTREPSPARPMGSRRTNLVCGPDITLPLKRVVNQIRLDFLKASKERRKSLCDVMFAIPEGAGAWDILSLKNRDWMRKDHPGCAIGKGCAGTVEVNGKCYSADAVNYIMWGVMVKLCDRALWSSKIWVRLYKAGRWFRFSLSQEMAWIDTGHDGWPLRGNVPNAPDDLKKCRTTCGPCRIKEFNYLWVGLDEFK